MKVKNALLLILILEQARAAAMTAEECEALAVWSVTTLCRELSLQNVRVFSGLPFVDLFIYLFILYFFNLVLFYGTPDVLKRL